MGRQPDQLKASEMKEILPYDKMARDVFTIYKITNLKNNKSYVGQTSKPLADRVKEHLIYDKRRPLFGDVEIFGREAFESSVLMITNSQNIADEAERFGVAKYETMHPVGYNYHTGGKSGGHIHRVSMERRSRFARANPHLYSRKHTDETKQKISEMRIKKAIGGQEILCVTTNKKYRSIAEAARELGTSSNNISGVVNGRHKTAAGMVFRKVVNNEL